MYDYGPEAHATFCFPSTRHKPVGEGIILATDARRRRRCRPKLHLQVLDDAHEVGLHLSHAELQKPSELSLYLDRPVQLAGDTLAAAAARLPTASKPLLRSAARNALCTRLRTVPRTKARGVNPSWPPAGPSTTMTNHHSGSRRAARAAYRARWAAAAAWA